MTFATPQVAKKFAAFPDEVREALLDLRSLILEVAAEDERIGMIEESLKWGQPAYRPKRGRIGTTLRLDAKGEDRCALYYHCQSNLGDQYQALYGDKLVLDRRSITIPLAELPDRDVIRHCVSMALTYHLRC